MNKGLIKIDEALRIGELELEKLQSGEVEEAEEYAQRRSDLLKEAGQLYQTECAEEFQSKLIQMQGLQGKLCQEAKQLHAFLQEELKKGKQQAAMHRGYSKTVTADATVIPMYMDRNS